MWWHVACEALQTGRRLELRYDGHSRIIEVHAVGTSKDGNALMRGWQTRCTKPGGNGCWRLYRLDKAWNYGLSDELSQAPRTGYKLNDSDIAFIRCQIQTTAGAGRGW